MSEKQSVYQQLVKLFNMQFQWQCCKKDLEKRSILEKVVPSDLKYKYKINSFKVSEESGIPKESKFEAEFLVNICSEEGLKGFLKEFEKSSSTGYNMNFGDKRDGKKFIISGYRKCHHNVRRRKKSGNESENDVIAEPKTVDKDTDCPAGVKFKLKKRKEHVHIDECSLFPLEVMLIYTHNHSIESANAVKFHEVSEETKERFIELFENDHSASSAYAEYKNYLMNKHGEHFVFVSADRAVMPDYKWVFNFHATFVHKVFGRINSPEAFEKAVKKVKDYNEKNLEALCSIKQTDDGETIVAVCDLLSRRVHKILPQAGDIVYVDATSNLGMVQY